MLHSADSAPEAAIISVQSVLVVVYSLTVSSLVSLLLPGVQKAKK